MSTEENQLIKKTKHGVLWFFGLARLFLWGARLCLYSVISVAVCRTCVNAPSNHVGVRAAVVPYAPLTSAGSAVLPSLVALLPCSSRGELHWAELWTEEFLTAEILWGQPRLQPRRVGLKYPLLSPCCREWNDVWVEAQKGANETLPER